MIVLLYLLVIAICVAFWAAASLLRETPEQTQAREARAGSGATTAGPSSRNRRRDDQPGDRNERSRRPDATHDAYRGARAKERGAGTRERSAATRPASRERVDVQAESQAESRADNQSEAPDPQTDRRNRNAHRPDLPRETSSGPVRTDGIRVTESRRQREERAQDAPAETKRDRASKEDPFDRFLRANEDFER